MKTIDTRDLIELRDTNKENMLADFNDKFNTDLDDYDEIDTYVPEEDDEEYENFEDKKQDFMDHWYDEIEEIVDIDRIEDEISEFEYGATLIDEDDFFDYCKELVDDIGDLPNGLPSYIENNIDWSGVADDLRVDYSSVTYKGSGYLVRD